MRRREVLALLPTIAITGCSAPTSNADSNGDPSNETETTMEGPGSDETPSLTITDRRCSNQEEGEATITIGSDSFTVEGTIIGSNMCFSARLDSVSYDEELGKTVLTVEAFRDADEDTLCATCLTAIEYTLIVPVERSLSEHVTIYHKKGGYTLLVASTQQ